MLRSARVQRGLLGVLVVLLAAIAAIVVLDRPSAQAGSPTGVESASTFFDGNVLPDVLAKPFTLRNQNGREVSLTRQRGHVVVLTWIHSLCKDDCPFMVEQIKGALNLLPDHGRSVRVIGVSVEPGQDTERRRRAFLAEHEMTRRMQFLNGPRATMRRVWRDYGIQPVTPKADHSAFVFLISKRGYERVGFPAVQLTSPELAHDIGRLQAESS